MTLSWSGRLSAEKRKTWTRKIRMSLFGLRSTENMPLIGVSRVVIQKFKSKRVQLKTGDRDWPSKWRLTFRAKNIRFLRMIGILSHSFGSQAQRILKG